MPKASRRCASLFLAKEEVLALLRPAQLSIALLQRVVVDGRRIPRQLGRLGLVRADLEDVASTTAADVGGAVALSAGDPAVLVSIPSKAWGGSNPPPPGKRATDGMGFLGRRCAAEQGQREREKTYGSTSWRSRVSAGSVFLAMLPVPPRPVVTTEVLRVGVSRSLGPSLGDMELLTMLPAPPRPEDCR